MNFLFLGLFAVLLIGSGAMIFRAREFAGRIEAWRETLAAAQTLPPPDQNTIPQIMRTFALRNGATVGGPATVVAHQAAEMTTGPGKPFFPVDAIQLFGTRDPGFVWEATATMARVVPIRVVDAYVGKGWLEVRIGGAIPVASATGADSDKGEIMRQSKTSYQANSYPPRIGSKRKSSWSAFPACRRRWLTCRPGAASIRAARMRSTAAARKLRSCSRSAKGSE